MKNTRYKFLVMITCVVAVGTVLQLIFYLRPPHITGMKNIEGVTEHLPGKKGEPEMTASRLGPVLESPLLYEDADIAKKAIQENDWFTKRENGVYTYLPFSNMQDPHTDIAMVELRFLQQNLKGEEKKLQVVHVNAYQRVGQYTTSIDDKGWEGGVAGYHVEACALRLPAGPPGEDYRFVGFGKRYHLTYMSVDKTFYESIIKIPEHIPDGKMAVIEVLAKPELSGGYVIPRTPPKPDTRILISGNITTSLPPTTTEWMVAYNHADEKAAGFTKIEDNGYFDLGRREPGGMLRVSERGRTGVAWIIIDSVDDGQLTLPEEADRVIPRNSLLDVEIAIPDEPDIQTFSGLWIVDDEAGLGPIAYQAAPSPYEPQKLERFYETGTLHMKAPPGKYWVKVYYDPPGEWLDQGWITVPEKDRSDKVPTLRPVAE